MFKWFLVIFLIFLGVWIFFKNDFPLSARTSQPAALVNSVMFPLEKLINKYEDILIKEDFSEDLKEINSGQLNRLLPKIGSGKKHVMFYFFPVDCFSCRIGLFSINKIIPDLRDKVQFFVVYVGSELEDYNLFLNQVGGVNYKKYYMTEDEFWKTKMAFVQRGQDIKELPATMISRRTQADFEKLTTGFFTTSRVRNIVEQRL